MTHKFTKNTRHTLSPATSFIAMCADYIIAINTTNLTEKQQFSAMTANLKSGF